MDNKVIRTFIPGDKWLYFKIYTGYKTSDIILSKILPDIISKLNSNHILHKWFFIRYLDPHFHLRLRFYVNEQKCVSQVISIVNEELTFFVSEDLIWKVQIDTYQRELERYGTSSIEHAETIFYYDSETIIKLLGVISEYDADQQCWLLALKMIDSLLCDFGFCIDQKLILLCKLSENFKLEFGFTRKEYKFQLDKKYRVNRELIEDILTDNPKKTFWASSLIEIIKQKSQKTKPIFDILLKMEKDEELENSLDDLLKSYIHMMINRLFRSKQRLTEMVLYDMLERYYSSQVARSKNNPTCHKNEILQYL